MSDDAALGELLERATKLGLLSESAVDKLTDSIASGECSEEAVMLCVTWKLEHPSELPLDNDAMVYLAECVDSDAHFAFALACKQFNAARRSSLKAPKLRMRARATLQSEAVRAWALALGCPSGLGFPCWAEARALTGAADLNGRVCLILGPPNGKGRCPVEFDTGWGSVEPKIMPEPGLILPDEAMPSDLTEHARKSVRLVNLRILDDDELQRAVRIMCKAELTVQTALGLSKLHKTDDGVPGSSGVGLLATWLPKRHSAVLFMRAWELGAQAEQEAIERAVNGGRLNPFCRRNCGTAGFFRAVEELSFKKEGMKGGGGILHEAPNFMSPLMASVGKNVFLQQVDIVRRVGADPYKLAGASALDNPCIAHLMSQPEGAGMQDSHVWVDPGSVVAFMTQQDLTPRDVELAWRFAIKSDRERYDSDSAFLANFTPEKYDKHVRICNVRDETMSRVSFGADGALVIDEEGW